MANGVNAMIKDTVLFAGTNYSFLDGVRPAGFSAPDYRIPSLVAVKGNIVAAIDSASGGMDWGKIGISVKVSENQGESWSDEIRIVSPPCGKAPPTLIFSSISSPFIFPSRIIYAFCRKIHNLFLYILTTC